MEISAILKLNNLSEEKVSSLIKTTWEKLSNQEKQAGHRLASLILDELNSVHKLNDDELVYLD